MQSSLAIMHGRLVIELSRHLTECKLHYMRARVSFLPGGASGSSFRRWSPTARANQRDMPITTQALLGKSQLMRLTKKIRWKAGAMHSSSAPSTPHNPKRSEMPRGQCGQTLYSHIR